MLSGLLPAFSAAVPARCEVCRAWPARPLCTACRARFATPAHRCPTCALALPPGAGTCGRCLREPPPLDACHAVVSYGFPWAGLLARFKFAADAGWSRTFAALMAAHPGVAREAGHADLVLPLPLSRERLASRGYNQAWELARRLAPKRADPHLLLRVRDTPSQVGLPRDERLANLRGAFALEPRRAAEMRGRSVLLVDDVMTSGASLFTAAAVLVGAGAARVGAAVFARTED